MKNKLCDLNNHLFEQIERLNDEELTGEALAIEVLRSKAVANIASKIIENGKLILDGEKFKNEYNPENTNVIFSNNQKRIK